MHTHNTGKTPLLSDNFGSALKGSLALCLALSLLPGCAANPGAKENLSAAFKELENPAPNSAAMIAAADAYLAEHPTGPGAAEALYLRGRALEEKAQRDASASQKDFADAQSFYAKALQEQPRPALEGLIRTGIGNVLYFQERYAAAVAELSAGQEKLEREADKAWALYRVGLCQQRLRQWEQADQTFAAVQQQFPNTVQARRAREHQGHRAFWVQVGAYASPKSADGTIADLKKLGLQATKFADPAGKGPQFVRVGPLHSYESARGVKDRVWAKYADTVILP